MTYNIFTALEQKKQYYRNLHQAHDLKNTIQFHKQLSLQRARTFFNKNKKL